MSNSSFHPTGRVVIALRLCSRIEEVCKSDHTDDPKYMSLTNRYYEALESPYRPESRELLKPLLIDITGKDHKDYYPSRETFKLAEVIFDKFTVDEIRDND